MILILQMGSTGNLSSSRPPSNQGGAPPSNGQRLTNNNTPQQQQYQQQQQAANKRTTQYEYEPISDSDDWTAEEIEMKFSFLLKSLISAPLWKNESLNPLEVPSANIWKLLEIARNIQKFPLKIDQTLILIFSHFFLLRFYL